MTILGILTIFLVVATVPVIVIAVFQSFLSFPGWRRWIGVAGSLCLAVGSVGFLANVASAAGGFNWLPSTFEWPAGRASGVVKTEDGYFVVPIVPAGRVQIYDADWRFIRGWRVEAHGSGFKLGGVTPPHRIHVITGRSRLHLVFDIDGKVLSEESYEPDTYSSFPERGEVYWVPTSPFLWVFSNVFLSWTLAAIGGAILFVSSRRRVRETTARVA